ncbi:MAG: hypothetical protein ACREEM_25910, partial [Blastocatellia bacterium]
MASLLTLTVAPAMLAPDASVIWPWIVLVTCPWATPANRKTHSATFSAGFQGLGNASASLMRIGDLVIFVILDAPFGLTMRVQYRA